MSDAKEKQRQWCLRDAAKRLPEWQKVFAQYPLRIEQAAKNGPWSFRSLPQDPGDWCRYAVYLPGTRQLQFSKQPPREYASLDVAMHAVRQKIRSQVSPSLHYLEVARQVSRFHCLTITTLDYGHRWLFYALAEEQSRRVATYLPEELSVQMFGNPYAASTVQAAVLQIVRLYQQQLQNRREQVHRDVFRRLAELQSLSELHPQF